jgi:transcriptional regulator with XRE-family HTH domain
MINPEKLKSLRARKGLTQTQLGAESKVDSITISRIEQGKVRRPKSATVHRLASALETTPADLAAPPDAAKPRPAGLDSRYETPLLNATRNALALVARRYGVRPRVIMELAPSLFVVAAERHLAERKARYESMDAALEQAESLSPKYLNLLGWRTDNAMLMEQDALNERDLFLDRRNDPDDVFRFGYEFETHAPFPIWLNKELKSLGYGGSIDWWQRDNPPRFTSDVVDAAWLTEGDLELASSVASGHLPLHKLQGEERSDPQLRLAALRRLKQQIEDTEIDINSVVAEMLDTESGNEEQI